MTNEQRAKEMTIAVTVGLLSYDETYDVILDELNAATESRDTRIKALNDALKPFAEAAKKEYVSELGDHQGMHLVYSQDQRIKTKPDLTVGDFRRAAAVIEEG